MKKYHVYGSLFLIFQIVLITMSNKRGKNFLFRRTLKGSGLLYQDLGLNDQEIQERNFSKSRCRYGCLGMRVEIDSAQINRAMEGKQ